MPWEEAIKAKLAIKLAGDLDIKIKSSIDPVQHAFRHAPVDVSPLTRACGLTQPKYKRFLKCLHQQIKAEYKSC